MRTGRGEIGNRLRRLARLPRADWGKAVSHAGLGVTVFAVAGLMAWETEDIRIAQVGVPFEHAGYQITLTDVQRLQGPNYSTTKAFMDVHRDGEFVVSLTPERRFYPVANMPTTEAGIDYGFWRDVYLVIGDPQDQGGWTVRTYIKPFANWLWAGCIIMSLGGLLSLSDRRYRVAAGSARTTPPPSNTVAAE
jgi:cytochrome c-type biogenesis protein CcmF